MFKTIAAVLMLSFTSVAVPCDTDAELAYAVKMCNPPAVEENVNRAIRDQCRGDEGCAQMIRRQAKNQTLACVARLCGRR